MKLIFNISASWLLHPWRLWWPRATLRICSNDFLLTHHILILFVHLTEFTLIRQFTFYIRVGTFPAKTFNFDMHIFLRSRPGNGVSSTEIERHQSISHYVGLLVRKSMPSCIRMFISVHKVWVVSTPKRPMIFWKPLVTSLKWACFLSYFRPQPSTWQEM